MESTPSSSSEHHIVRARLLLQQSRPTDAERELRQALAAAPENPDALILLAASLSDQGKAKYPEALAAARAAISLAPAYPSTHYIHGLVLHNLDREREAQAAAEEALRLDPNDPDYHVLLGSIHLARHNRDDALASADRALALSPENTDAANLRAMALVRLGRKEEASATTRRALANDPENALAHANQGWVLLHRNSPGEAREHFREALKLDPSCEYARQGMLESLRARNPIYRGLLAWFLWMTQLGPKLQWAVIIGLWFGGRFFRLGAEANPKLAPLFWGLYGVLLAFCYLTWTATPLFNLFLRLDRFGRYVLSREERTASNWFGGVFLGMLVALGWAALGGGEHNALVLAVVLAILSVCVSIVFTRTGGARVTFAVLTVALGLLGFGGWGLLLVSSSIGWSLLSLGSFGVLGILILANFWRS